MSKVTFRADDDLVERLERLDVSKSEAMREALRGYLGAEGLGDADRQPERERASTPPQTETVDDLIRERVDELLADRLADLDHRAAPDRRDSNGHQRYRDGMSDVTVSVSLPSKTAERSSEERCHVDDRSARNDGPGVERTETNARVHDHDSESGDDDQGRRRPSDETTTRCDQCGEHVDDDHVYCPNCGEKTSRRLFCDCGDEIRSDWAFCPSCGRRTPAADVLD